MDAFLTTSHRPRSLSGVPLLVCEPFSLPYSDTRGSSFCCGYEPPKSCFRDACVNCTSCDGTEGTFRGSHMDRSRPSLPQDSRCAPHALSLTNTVVCTSPDALVDLLLASPEHGGCLREWRLASERDRCRCACVLLGKQSFVAPNAVALTITATNITGSVTIGSHLVVDGTSVVIGGNLEVADHELSLITDSLHASSTRRAARA